MNGVITVEGGMALQGRVRIEGAKNACLPIMAAALLCREEVVLCDVPALEDVLVMCRVLEALGATVAYDAAKKELGIKARTLHSIEAPASLVHKMRASFLVAGPVLAREGGVKIPLPGGCAIGIRPIDLHLKGLKALGAEVTIGHGLIEAAAKKLGCETAVQVDQLGTGHAVLSAREALKGFSGATVVLFADTPLIRPETLGDALATIEAGAGVAVVGFDAAAPGAYGRLVVREGELIRIVEAADATPQELEIGKCNSGVVAAGSADLFAFLAEVNDTLMRLLKTYAEAA